MKTDLNLTPESADLVDSPEQMAFEFADVRTPRLPPALPRTSPGYFVDVRPMQTRNGLDYELSLYQDRATGVILSYRLTRVTPNAPRGACRP